MGGRDGQPWFCRNLATTLRAPCNAPLRRVLWVYRCTKALHSFSFSPGNSPGSCVISSVASAASQGPCTQSVRPPPRSVALLAASGHLRFSGSPGQSPFGQVAGAKRIHARRCESLVLRSPSPHQPGIQDSHAQVVLAHGDPCSSCDLLRFQGTGLTTHTSLGVGVRSVCLDTLPG